MSRLLNNQPRRIAIYRLQRRPSFGFESSVSSTPMTSGDPVVLTSLSHISRRTPRNSYTYRNQRLQFSIGTAIGVHFGEGSMGTCAILFGQRLPISGRLEIFFCISSVRKLKFRVTIWVNSSSKCTKNPFLAGALFWTAHDVIGELTTRTHIL